MNERIGQVITERIQFPHGIIGGVTEHLKRAVEIALVHGEMVDVSYEELGQKPWVFDVNVGMNDEGVIPEETAPKAVAINQAPEAEHRGQDI